MLLLYLTVQKQKEFADEMAEKEKVMRDQFIARVSRKEEEMKKREELVSFFFLRLRRLFYLLPFLLCRSSHFTVALDIFIQLNKRAKEIKDTFENEMKQIESQINSLMEEKMKLENKINKKARK